MWVLVRDNKRRHFCLFVWWQSSCVSLFVEVFIVWKVSHTNHINKVTATSAQKKRDKRKKNKQPQWQTIFGGFCCFFVVQISFIGWFTNRLKWLNAYQLKVQNWISILPKAKTPEHFFLFSRKLFANYLHFFHPNICSPNTQIWLASDKTLAYTESLTNTLSHISTRKFP